MTSFAFVRTVMMAFASVLTTTIYVDAFVMPDVKPLLLGTSLSSVELQPIKKATHFEQQEGIFLLTSTTNSPTSKVRQSRRHNDVLISLQMQRRRHQRQQKQQQLRHEDPSTQSKNDLYMKQLSEAARDPKTFEQFVLNHHSSKNDTIMTNSNTQSPVKKIDLDSSQRRVRSYQRVEEWDAEQQQKKKKNGSGMEWEERVKFDGQRFGNQVKQNDILIRNLHQF